jgi:hypothetical protein
MSRKSGGEIMVVVGLALIAVSVIAAIAEVVLAICARHQERRWAQEDLDQEPVQLPAVMGPIDPIQASIAALAASSPLRLR